MVDPRRELLACDGGSLYSPPPSSHLPRDTDTHTVDSRYRLSPVYNESSRYSERPASLSALPPPHPLPAHQGCCGVSRYRKLRHKQLPR